MPRPRAMPVLSALACALAMGVVLAPLAGAADDGGTRSIFASGAGPRALAMGGAFTGVADDASAILWNPAGLGRLQRMEIQAAHTEYAATGASEDYAAFALPDWRWGAIGISLRHFGVDGIERRDDRNLLLDGDLSDSETEIALGFGRSLSDVLGIGGAIKLQRQSLAGFSGGGFGADLGVLLRPSGLVRSPWAWVDRVTFGLSVRNIIQPSIRLDQETVRDPAVTRTGIAYELPLRAGKGALIALDFEKSAGIATRLHAGVDVAIHPLLRLRWGMNRGTLTAGTAVLWRDFALDYTFEDGDVVGVHRVGISRALGATVKQRRETASLERENAIQARLDAAFQKRQEEQTGHLLAQVRAAHERADFEEALKLLATVEVLYPGQSEVPALELQSLRGRARLLEASGDDAGALAAFGRVLAVAPGDTAAVAGQSRARERALAAATRVQAMAAGADTTATPPGTLPDRKPRAAETRAAAAAERVADPPASRVLTKERLREIADLYRRGVAAMSDGRSDDAVRYWEMVRSMDPRHERVAEYLKREYLMRGMEHFASSRLEPAIAQWERVLEVDPADQRAAAYIARARSQLARTRERIGAER
jgi:tetratricopeptide (TPR) repeat protein